MSEKYFYTKSLNSDVLDEAIRLRTSVRNELIGCKAPINHDGSVNDDNVELEFSRALTSSEQDEITNIINIIGPTYDLQIRKDIQTNTMSWARAKGMELMDAFAANNIYRGKTPEQVHHLVTDYPEMLHSFMTGSLQTSLEIFTAMVPDANISQEEIDEFKLRIMIILGV